MCNIFIVLWLRIINRSKCSVHEFFFIDIFNDISHGRRAAILKESPLPLRPFHIAVATYWCNENVSKTMRTAILSYLLTAKQLLFFQATRRSVFVLKASFNKKNGGYFNVSTPDKVAETKKKKKIFLPLDMLEKSATNIWQSLKSILKPLSLFCYRRN